LADGASPIWHDCCVLLRSHNEPIPLDKLRELVQKAEDRSIVAQTLFNGVRLCTCLKGDTKAYKTPFGLEKDVSAKREEEFVQGRPKLRGKDEQAVPSYQQQLPFKQTAGQTAGQWPETTKPGMVEKRAMTGAETQQAKGETASR